jgi:hypothetical protein
MFVQFLSNRRERHLHDFQFIPVYEVFCKQLAAPPLSPSGQCLYADTSTSTAVICIFEPLKGNGIPWEDEACDWAGEAVKNAHFPLYRQAS